MTLKTQKEALLLHGKVNRLFLSSMITEISKERNLLWHTTLEQSLVCYTLPEVYRLPVRTYAAIAINAPYRWRSSSHKANLIPQSKRQDTTVIVIPCLCSFNALCSPSAEFPINKKRTRTLSHRELGSSTNCMVDGTGLEPVTSCTSSRCSTS